MKNEKLHNIKSNGFKTPNNYFESFEDKLFERLNEKETIEGINDTGYKTPNGYFNTIEDKIVSQLNVDKKPLIRLKSRTTFYYIVGIAASFVLFFSLFFNNSRNISFDDLETVIIESYLYQEEYSDDELALLFNNDELSITDFTDYSLSKEMIDQFIEDLDIEELILK